MRPVSSMPPVERGGRPLLLRCVLGCVCGRRRSRAGARSCRRRIRCRAAGRSRGCIGCRRGRRCGCRRGCSDGGGRGGSCRLRRLFLAATDQHSGEGNSDEDRAFHVLPLKVAIVGVVRRRAECSEWVSAHASRTTMDAKQNLRHGVAFDLPCGGVGQIVRLEDCLHPDRPLAGQCLLGTLQPNARMLAQPMCTNAHRLRRCIALSRLATVGCVTVRASLQPPQAPMLHGSATGVHAAGVRPPGHR